MSQAPAGSGPRRRTVLAAALAPLAAAGCAGEERPPKPRPGPEAAKDALVMVIRHAEKPYAGDTGEDDEGNEDPGFLAVRGRRRAQELPTLFPPARGAALPRPGAVFAAGGRAGRPRGAARRSSRSPPRWVLPSGRNSPSEPSPPWSGRCWRLGCPSWSAGSTRGCPA